MNKSEIKLLERELKVVAEAEVGNVEDFHVFADPTSTKFFCRFRTRGDAVKSWRKWIRAFKDFERGRVREGEMFKMPADRIDPPFLAWRAVPMVQVRAGFIYVRARLWIGHYESKKLVIDPATKNPVYEREDGRGVSER